MFVPCKNKIIKENGKIKSNCMDIRNQFEVISNVNGMQDTFFSLKMEGNYQL